MKTVLCAFLLSFLSLPAFADVPGVVRRLDAAQGQLQAAQQQLDAAKQELYQLLQDRGPSYVCVFNFDAFENGRRQYTGHGATEDEARQNAVFQCNGDSSHHYGSLCKDMMKMNTQCRAVNR
jgi:hypothetical protein